MSRRRCHTILNERGPAGSQWSNMDKNSSKPQEEQNITDIRVIK
jgi:hypothetical protein